MKQDTWERILPPSLRERFLRFDDAPSHDADALPLMYMDHLHTPRHAIVIDVLYQTVLLLYIARHVYGVHHMTMTASHITLHRIPPSTVVLFTCDDETSFMIDCRHGYHVRLWGFCDAMALNEPLSCRDPPQWTDGMHSILIWAKCMLSETSDHHHKITRLMTHVLTMNRFPTGLSRDECAWFCELCPLMTLRRETDGCESNDEASLVQRASSAFSLFMKEIRMLESQCRRKEVAKEIVRALISIINHARCTYMPDKWLSDCVDEWSTDNSYLRLRRSLYQYIVQRKYTHIHLSKIRLRELILSLLQWASLYEHVYSHIVNVHANNLRHYLVVMGCIETHMWTETISSSSPRVERVEHVDLSSSATSHMYEITPPTSLTAYHPMLRPTHVRGLIAS